MTPDTNTTDPITVTAKDAAKLLGISPWSVYQLCEQKKVASRYHGRRRLIELESLRDYVKSLPTERPEVES